MTDILSIAVNAADDKKAHDLVALDISEIASFAGCFLICTGDSSRQVKAIADEIEKKLKLAGIMPSHIEGYQNAEWVLMDYADLVVHIFSQDARAYYDLERLWRDAKKIDTGKLLKPSSMKQKKRTAL
ncbi:MAG TPA: ribosome silencing factor [Acidobacteriota bacterium]|nr:ribosome silencing factor [Acidobacteriota bacterium]